MKYDPISRRFFLQGMGQFTLALPFLPSLLARSALAATPPLRFVAIRSWYGQTAANWYSNLDASGILTQQAPGVFGRQISTLSGPVNRVIGTRFDGVKHKMSLLLGLDVVQQGGPDPDHNDSSMLCASTYSTFAGETQPDFPYSVDVILENNPLIYPTGSSPKVRVLRLAPALEQSNGSFSWNKVNGIVQRIPSQSNAQSIFQALFGGSTGGGTGRTGDQLKSLVIDKVLPDLNRLIGSTKLSSADKTRVSNYADVLRDLQTRLQTSPAPTQCTNPSLNSDTSQMRSAYSNHIDIAVAALACGLTRVVTIEARHFEDNPNYNGTAFHEPSHVESSDSDSKSLTYNTWIADRVAELFNKLNAVIEPDGSRLLDNTIAFWGNELSSRQNWHRQENMPVLIAGAQSKLKAGWIYDYRTRPFRYYANRGDFPSTGRPYNELLITLMSALGLSPANWEKDGQQGFGSYNKGGYYNGEYDAYLSNKRATLPLYYLG
jgi:hypothetical protein